MMMNNHASLEKLPPGIRVVNCPLCDFNVVKIRYVLPIAKHYLGKFAQDNWNVVRCQNCGLIYVNPQPDNASLEVFYNFESKPEMDFVEDWFLKSADLQRSTWRRFLRTIRHYVSGRQLLDVGCGAGSFLKEAEKVGFDGVGQDISPWFVEYCRNQQGLNAYEGNLGDISFSVQFDCITAFDVIEHHPKPQQLLAEIRRLLKPGGMLVLTTHDIGNFFARVYGIHWRYLHPFHLTYFTQTTLRKMLETCGYRVVYSGGAHTIDENRLAEVRNFVIQFFRVIVLRALILLFYKPLADRIPSLTQWRIYFGDIIIDHPRLMTRVGRQVIMNDDMFFLAIVS